MNAKLIKELRDISGAGMMDCKKALEENDNDIKKAIKKAYENENYKDIVAPLINSSIGEKKDEHSNDTIITVAILVVLVGGIGSLVYFSRKKQK